MILGGQDCYLEVTWGGGENTVLGDLESQKAPDYLIGVSGTQS